jgi:hypothetical protein
MQPGLTARRSSFAHDELGGQLLAQVVSTMDVLNQINGLMVAGGLLPAFTRPATTPEDTRKAGSA